jgi:hypothetical protein
VTASTGTGSSRRVGVRAGRSQPTGGRRPRPRPRGEASRAGRRTTRGRLGRLVGADVDDLGRARLGRRAVVPRRPGRAERPRARPGSTCCAASSRPWPRA